MGKILSYGSEKHVGNVVDRLGWRRAHQEVNYPREFEKKKLNRTEMIEYVDTHAEKYNHWHGLIFSTQI